jgi:prepilin-type N-terminal cleavage/methylation domain-containing protein
MAERMACHRRNAASAERGETAIRRRCGDEALATGARRPRGCFPIAGNRRNAASANGAEGFTLVEMMAALAILLFGITALLGAMSSSVAQRRSTDAMLEAQALCDHALLRLQQEAVRRKAGASTDLELEIVPLQDQTAPGFPGMTWSGKAIEDENRPDVWLIELEFRWLEAGEGRLAEFKRILPKQLPLRDRVLRFREERTETTPR